MLDTSSYVTIYCPECGDAAEDMPPKDWREPGTVPGYRHVGDRTALCPVMTRTGTGQPSPSSTRPVRDGDVDEPAGRPGA